ncbi:MAG: tetratricopeptide repeat protein [candidate division Zixibacteria bacterium]|nr:tetratricopeptide repeat protein [candidate division Zixibacteria bacterium]
MSGCIDKRLGNKLYAYELGMLGDQEREEFEIHLLECESCNARARKFQLAGRLLRNDHDVRDTIGTLAGPEENDNVSENITPLRRWWQSAIPATVAVAVILVILLAKPWNIQIQPDLEAIAARNSLAVMYFDNIADESDSGRLGEIATNLLITDLSESQYVRVLSSQRLHDVLKLMDKAETRHISKADALAVADQTGARWIIFGSILQVTPHLEITSQLIEVESGEVESSQRVSGEPDESIFTVIDKLAADIRNDLSLPEVARREPDRSVADITTHSSDAYRHYLEGLEYKAKMFLDEAATSFTKAIEFDSSFAMAYYYLSELRMYHSRREMIDLARKYAEKATVKEQLYIFSRVAWYDERPEEAVEILRTLVKRYPDEKEAWLWLGIYEYQQYHFDKSVEFLKKAIEIDPLYKQAYNQLAYSYQLHGDFEQAVFALNQYIALVPDEPNPYDSRGEIFMRYGRLDQAIESFEKALELKPDFYASMAHLTQIYTTRGEYDSAERYYKKMTESKNWTYRSVGFLGLAILPIYQGKFAKGLEVLDRYIADFDWEDDQYDNQAFLRNVYILKAKIYTQLRQYDRALEVYADYEKMARKVMDEDERLLYTFYQPQIMAESGDIAGAEAVLAKLAADTAKSMSCLNDYYYVKGVIALARGDAEQAIELIQAAKDAEKNFHTGYMLGLAYLEAGQLGQAVELFEYHRGIHLVWSVFKTIWDVKLHYYLAQAYEQSHWNDKAAREYEIFIEIWQNADPGCPELDDARERLARLQS